MSKQRIRVSREQILQTRVNVLERELKRIAEASPDTIDLESIVSDRTGTGMVRVVWGKQVATLSVNEARDHAVRLLETANAAETDAFVHQYMLSRGVDSNGAAVVMHEFREYREERKRKDYLPSEPIESKGESSDES